MKIKISWCMKQAPNLPINSGLGRWRFAAKEDTADVAWLQSAGTNHSLPQALGTAPGRLHTFSLMVGMDTKTENSKCNAVRPASLKLGAEGFTLEHIEELRRLQDSPKDCIRYLGEVLGLEKYQTEAHDAFMLDYFHGINLFFQHHALYKCCFSKGCCTEIHKEVVHIETALIPPLLEALSKEELEAQEKIEKEALEAEEREKQEAAAKAEAERVAAAEVACIEENKHKPPTLDEAVEFIVREKLETFKESFFKGCFLQQKALLEKLEQLEIIAGLPSDNKARKP